MVSMAELKKFSLSTSEKTRVTGNFLPKPKSQCAGSELTTQKYFLEICVLFDQFS